MSEPVLKIEKEGGTVVLTLNRPGAMNALSRALRSALVAAFTDLQRDPEARVVILTGAGRAFCAGLDLKELGGEGVAAAEPGTAVAEARHRPGDGGAATVRSSARSTASPSPAASSWRSPATC